MRIPPIESEHILVFVDIDGVLRNFVKKMKEVFADDFPGERIIREDDYDLTLWTTIGKNIFPWVMEGGSAENIFTQAEPHYKSLQALQNWLKSPGKYPKFFIVSHQVGSRIKWTEAWLKEHQLDDGLPVYYTTDKTKVMKSIIQSESDIMGEVIPPEKTILLDDNPKELSAAALADIKTICIDRTWNQNCNAKRIRNLAEFNPF
ncbi:MAG: hypothetical protein HQ591_00610 [candidate division Zixibacteria bacterium]|nr:hypothetical protein [Candidatus Tariuqbacter arcticus]